MSADATVSDELDIDLTDIKMLGERLITGLNAIREAEAIYWSAIQKGWFVTRFADVSEGFAGDLPLSNVRLDKLAFAAIPEQQWPERIPLLTTGTPTFANMTDPPYHTRLRKPVNAAFLKPKIEKMFDFVHSRLDVLLDEAESIGEFDFIDAIARPLTGSVIMRLMGVPQTQMVNLRDWSNSIVKALGTISPPEAVLEDGERAMREMDKLFGLELEQRRTAPREDFLSVLAAASEGDDGLIHPELLGTCVNVLIAGHDSTASTMALGVAALAQYPEQLDYMLSHPDRKPQTVEEVSRYAAMSASQTRLALTDFQWHGKQIRKGDVIYLWVASASRDPRVFSNPDELDLSRNIRESLVFGRGIHHCIGHFLAKLQLGEFFPAMFERFDVEILDDPLDYNGGYSFRTLSTLNVRVTPRQGRLSVLS